MSCLGCEVRDNDLQALRQRFDSILGHEIEKRRREQDKQWGGPEHDDKHGQYNWILLLRKFTNMTESAIDCDALESYEDNLIDVAALCIAAIQSSRRKRGAA